MKKILHQLTAVFPIIYRVSTILLVVQEVATIQPGLGTPTGRSRETSQVGPSWDGLNHGCRIIPYKRMGI